MASSDRTTQVAARQPERHRPALDSGSLVLNSTTLYAGPSPLAEFILNGLVSSDRDLVLATSRGTVVAALEHEIQELLDLNKSTNSIAGDDVSFLSLLVDSLVLNINSATRSVEAPALAKGVARLRVDDEDDLGASSGADSVEISPSVTPKRRIDVVAEYSAHQKSRETLNLAVVGHVDAGKSTLMGHLLYALGQVNERTIKRFERDAEKIGKGSFAFAWVLDETDEERSRGVTMDTATSAFTTPNRKFTLLDTPGHRDFVPNMISGASRADVAILVVDASTGGFESGFDGNGQTREHAILIRSLGVRQLVVAVNKLDVVEWSEARYREITGRLLDFLTGCGYVKEDVRFAPVSGLKGINLARRITADNTPELAAWYRDASDLDKAGPCLVDLIDIFTMPERPVSKPFRLAVTDYFKGGTFSSANS
ncbi:hypothetical protein GGI21_004514, partial [Coemansia aciculifera]